MNIYLSKKKRFLLEGKWG